MSIATVIMQKMNRENEIDLSEMQKSIEAIKVRCGKLQKLQQMEDEMHKKLMTERRQLLEDRKLTLEEKQMLEEEESVR